MAGDNAPPAEGSTSPESEDKPETAVSSDPADHEPAETLFENEAVNTAIENATSIVHGFDSEDVMVGDCPL